MHAKPNPFAQSPHYWKAVFALPAVAVATAEGAFDDIALSVSDFETDEENGVWTFDLLFEAPPDKEEITRRLWLLAAAHGIDAPAFAVKEVAPQDWLSRVARDFPPLSIGRFYVHGSHSEKTPPAGSIAIRVDAGAAFGSGEHGTTSACLEALDWLARKRRFRRVLDMGCGSGILAIASAKLWRAQVLAVDIDPVAARVARENVQANRVQVETGVSDGYAGEQVRRGGRYDLIIANILARPLIKFAPDLARHLADGGVAVLSGLLASQETQVLAAHRMQGLRLMWRFTRGNWRTLVLKA